MFATGHFINILAINRAFVHDKSESFCLFAKVPRAASSLNVRVYIQEMIQTFSVDDALVHSGLNKPIVKYQRFYGK